MSCDRQTRPRYSAVSLGHRASAESVPKIHAALHAYHAALSKTNVKIYSPKCSPPPSPNAIKISS